MLGVYAHIRSIVKLQLGSYFGYYYLSLVVFLALNVLWLLADPSNYFDE